MTYCSFISALALADIIAYVQKKKKVVSSQSLATTAVKTSVSFSFKFLNAFSVKMNHILELLPFKSDRFNSVTFCF